MMINNKRILFKPLKQSQPSILGVTKLILHQNNVTKQRLFSQTDIERTNENNSPQKKAKAKATNTPSSTDTPVRVFFESRDMIASVMEQNKFSTMKQTVQHILDVYTQKVAITNERDNIIESKLKDLASQFTDQYEQELLHLKASHDKLIREKDALIHNQTKLILDLKKRNDNFFATLPIFNATDFEPNDALPNTMHIEDNVTFQVKNSNLKCVNGELHFPVRNNSHATNIKKSPCTQAYRRLAAKIMRSGRIMPGRVQHVIETVFGALGIIPDGSVPTRDTHTRIMHEYALMGSLQFYSTSKGKDKFVTTDDFTRKKAARQVTVIGSEDELHFADISRLFDGKTAEAKYNSLMDYNTMIKKIVTEVNLTGLTESDVDMTKVIVSKVNDRNAVELALNKKLAAVSQTVFTHLPCATHIVNTCSEASTSARGDQKSNDKWKDAGFVLRKSMVQLYHNNIRLRGYLYQKTGREYSFAPDQVSRGFKAYYDAKEVYDLVPHYRSFVTQEVAYEKIRQTKKGMNKKESVLNVQLLESLQSKLSSSEHLSGLYINVVELCKLIRPGMRMMKTLSGARYVLALKDVSKLLGTVQKNPEELTMSSAQVLMSDFIKKKDDLPTLLYNEMNHSDLLEAGTVTIQAWKLVIDKVLSEYKEQLDSMTEEEIRRIDFTPCHSNHAESMVGYASHSVRLAPYGTTAFHASRVMLLKNNFPSVQFEENLNSKRRATIRKHAKALSRSKEREKALSKSITALQEAEQTIKEHMEAQELQQAIADFKRYEQELVGDSDDSSDRTQTIQIRPALPTDVANMDIESIPDLTDATLKDIMRKHGLGLFSSRGKIFRVFSLQNYIRYCRYSESERTTIRDNVMKIVGTMNEMKNEYLDIKSRLSCQELRFRPAQAYRSVINDVEWCFKSSVIPQTNKRRPGGRQFYSIAKVDVFARTACHAYARRRYISPVQSAGISIDARTDHRILSADQPGDVLKCILQFEQELNVEAIIELHWAKNNSDITVQSDGLEEAGLSRSDSVTIIHANALSIAKLLLPGMSSYSLAKLPAAISFPAFEAHNPLADCIASWWCLLYAIHCHLGATAVLTEDTVNSFLVKILSEFKFEVKI